MHTCLVCACTMFGFRGKNEIFEARSGGRTFHHLNKTCIRINNESSTMKHYECICLLFVQRQWVKIGFNTIFPPSTAHYALEYVFFRTDTRWSEAIDVFKINDTKYSCVYDVYTRICQDLHFRISIDDKCMPLLIMLIEQIHSKAYKYILGTLIFLNSWCARTPDRSGQDEYEFIEETGFATIWEVSAQPT